MRKIVSLFVLAAVLAGGRPAFAASSGEGAPFASSDDFGAWMTAYYRSPEPARVGPAAVYFCDTLGGVKMTSRMAVAAFFAGIFRKDPATMRETYRLAASGSEDLKMFLSNAIWLADTPEARGLLESASREWTAAPLPEILGREIQAPPKDILTAPLSPPILDMLWANFSATGDPAPVLRVIKAGELKENAKGGDLATADSAIYSLGSNIKQHDKVREICEQEFAKATGFRKIMLGRVLDGTWISDTGK
ncbi:MAG TPA: hypothetical protein VL404_08230 [Candidatus Eisenbacteria bacterium]|nr:hypothetical protein [Candidatus Eisenbacteria bacterium]